MARVSSDQFPASASSSLGDDYSLRLCEQIARWRFDDLPADVVHKLKLFVLDTLGVIGGAAHAPRIRELNQRLPRWESTGSATGLLSKRLGAGFAARGAVLSAFLAADGLTGTRRTLEGNAGLFALYERAEVKPEILTDGLGTHWRIREYSFKPYPCCRCNHTAIGLGIKLREQDVKPGDV